MVYLLDVLMLRRLCQIHAKFGPIIEVAQDDHSFEGGRGYGHQIAQTVWCLIDANQVVLELDEEGV